MLVFLSIVPLFMFVGKNFLPVDDQSQFEISVRAPEGYEPRRTSQIFERIASEIRKMPGVTDTLVDGRRRHSSRSSMPVRSM